MTSPPQEFTSAYKNGNGYRVASVFIPYDDSNRLSEFYNSSTSANVIKDLRNYFNQHRDSHFSRADVNVWVEIFAAFWRAIGELTIARRSSNVVNHRNAQWAKLYEAWKEFNNTLIRGFNSNALPPWTLPCLYTSGKYLRLFATQADMIVSMSMKSAALNNAFEDDVKFEAKNEKLEDCAQQLRRIFSLCVGDRAPPEESRKWGLYYVASLMFKTYFKLDTVTQSKNIIQSIEVSMRDMPPIEAFPKSHRVAYNYYVGRIYFMEEDYLKAEEHLSSAWRLCHRAAKKNLELILTYLIPCHLLTTHTLPTEALMGPYPRLRRLFGPLGECIKKGNLAGFDAALVAGEAEFVRQHIYLTLERGRDIALRNLFRKVFISGGFDPLKEGQTEANRIRRTRIPLAEFIAAMRLSMHLGEGDILEDDEVECMIANMIYKNLMKGYISRERRVIVLSKGGTAFPGTGV